MPREFYPFRFFDPLRQRWIRARYVEELETIRERYERWELEGPPELRGDAPLEPCSFPLRGPSAP